MRRACGALNWQYRELENVGEAAGGLRQRGRRIAVPLFALLALAPILLAGCAIGGGQAGHLASLQVFTWPYYDTNAQDPNHPNILAEEVFDPAAINTLYDEVTGSLLFTTLLAFNSTLQIVPNAAISMPTISANGTTYTFHLRPNMKFSDGTPLTAKDFAYSFNRALDPNLCSVVVPSAGPALDALAYPPSTGLCFPLSYGPDNTGYLGHLLGAGNRNSGAIPSIVGSGKGPDVGVVVEDPLTLEVRLDKPVQFLLDTMTFPSTSPVEQKLVDAYPGGLWVRHLDTGGCSGPFMVQSYGNGAQLTMVPNPYWEAAWNQTLTLSAVVRPAVTSEDTEYQNYDRNGQYDYTDVPLDDYSFAQSQSDFHELASLETDYFGISTLQPPFDSLQVRQAFDLALNKQYIVDTIEQGGAVPTNHIIPSGMPGYYAGLLNPPPDRTQSITGNQAAARALLQQAKAKCAGWNGGPNPPQDWCPYIVGPNLKPIDVYAQATNQTRIRLTTDATDQWSATLGLNVQMKPVDALIANVYGGHNTYPAWIVGWVADYPDPQDWTTLQFTQGAPNNVGGWNILGFDSLVAKADVDPNYGRRISEYNQAEQMAVDYCGWIPLQQQKLAWRIRSSSTREVLGFTYDALDLVPQLQWPQVEIWVPGVSQ